jgi:hypothetical protein
MLRRNHIITAAVLAASAVPASAAMAQHVGLHGQDLRPPDARDAAEHRGLYEATPKPQPGSQDLRMPDTRDAARGANTTETPAAPGQDLRSPDARDAARDLPPVHIPAPVIEVREVPSSGFDWGDAGIGAAGMLALFSIAAGSTLLVTNRRRRRGFQVAAQ